MGAGGGEGGAASAGIGNGVGRGVGAGGGEGEAPSSGVGCSEPGTTAGCAFGAAGAPSAQDAAKTSAKSQTQHCQYRREAPMSGIHPSRDAVSVPDATACRDALACTWSPGRGLSLTPQEGGDTLRATKSETL